MALTIKSLQTGAFGTNEMVSGVNVPFQSCEKRSFRQLSEAEIGRRWQLNKGQDTCSQVTEKARISAVGVECLGDQIPREAMHL